MWHGDGRIAGVREMSSGRPTPFRDSSSSVGDTLPHRRARSIVPSATSASSVSTHCAFKAVAATPALTRSIGSPPHEFDLRPAPPHEGASFFGFGAYVHI